ncbi:sister chromatid cohesion protein DCC1 [Lasioglossum baleicum]|uniref:sister chromatid cohesion protein DCC1 n=1 Tax=Lasioglossum baleicum TaxID=434251 RepID=UPI003FCE4310
MSTLTVNNRQDRTMDEIRETLELAVIKESDLQNLTQILYSATDSNINNRTKLLELDQHLLETIKAGDSLTFQGNKEDSVVICTKCRTYDIKEAETSNSCLLVPNLNLFKQTNVPATNDRVTKDYNISGVFHTYYEVKECKPKLEKLLSILEPTTFKGMEYESAVSQELLYDWEKLRSEVQASEDELNRALNDYLIVNIDGYYRLISFEAEVRSLTLMLDLFDENSWELDQVDKEVTYETLKEFIPESVFDVLFAKYAEASSKSKQDGTPLHRYIEEKCCKCLAQVLLAASAVTEHKQFMESWNIGTPEKMEPKEEYLSGVALVTWNGSTLTKEVVSFPEADLSKNINERFNELFKAKDKWTMQEIAPYVLIFTTDKMNANALLTKHARCSMVKGVKYYSSKHGK